MILRRNRIGRRRISQWGNSETIRWFNLERSIAMIAIDIPITIESSMAMKIEVMRTRFEVLRMWKTRNGIS
jgi:hypothetical protein